MNPIDWLCKHAPGFQYLSKEERDAIADFALLWSFFEATLLNTNASAKAIIHLTSMWESQGQLNLDSFEPSMVYFQARYFREGSPTHNLHTLYLRDNDSPKLVHSMLQGEDLSVANKIAALLIIVLRLRNNLFHGAKWAYGIQGQLENFRHANKVLMSALEVQGYF